MSYSQHLSGDCVLYRLIESEEDTKKLERDLDALQEWITNWMMHFIAGNCNVIHFCPKPKEAEEEFFIQCSKLERLIHTKYCRVRFDQNFKWTCHVDTVVKKASRMLGFVCHNIHSSPKSFKKVWQTHLYPSPLGVYSHCVGSVYPERHLPPLNIP